MQEKFLTLFVKRFNIRRSQNVVQNKKAFRNKQYTPKSKDQLLESERTRFYVRFNNSNIAMHRPTIIFLLFHQIATVQQKNNQNKQSDQSTAKSIPKTTTSVNSKINHKNGHDKQSTIAQSKILSR